MLRCAGAVLPLPRRGEGTQLQPGPVGQVPHLCAAAPSLSAAGHRASNGAPRHGCYTNSNINKHSAPFLISHAVLQTSEDYAPRHTREYGNHVRISGFILF